MRKLFLAGLMAAGSVFAVPVFQIIPNIGPDAFTTSNPVFDGWAANVMAGLQGGVVPVGSGVTAFTPLANGVALVGNEMTESATGGFTSWMGQLNPTGTFANELGSQLYFSVIIKDSQGAATIRLDDLTSIETFLGTGPSGPFAAGGTYRANLVGIDGGNNVLNSGQAGSTAVKELYWTGVGFVSVLEPGATPQDQLDATLAVVQAAADKTTEVCYSVGTQGTGCGNVTYQNPIPEPGTMALLGLGLAGVAYLRRRSA